MQGAGELEILLYKNNSFLILSRYLSEECYEELSLMRDPNFKWLIENDVDTTVAGNNCAYDR